MAQTTAKKSEIIEKYKVHPSDTGSSEVQIALLTDHIKYLTEHFQTHKKDQIRSHSFEHGLFREASEPGGMRMLLQMCTGSKKVFSYSFLV